MSIKTISFVTTNNHKFDVLKNALAKYELDLVQEKIDTPEIQDVDLVKIVEFSASWAANKLGKPVLVNDFGYFITGLNGFPGPFSKQVINWFEIEDFARLFSGLEDRSIVVKWAYAVCSPGNKPVSIVFQRGGKLAEKPGFRGDYNEMQQFFIPEGYDKVYSELSDIDRENYHSKKNDFKTLANTIDDYLNNA